MKTYSEPQGPPTSVQPYKQVILFGDSITQGSGDQLNGFGFHPAFQNDYIRRLDVINRGFSGYNTRQALSALPWVIPTPAQGDVRLITIFFGANDATIPGHYQHIPLDEFKQNIKDVVHHPLITAHSSTKILLLTPPPVNEDQLGNSDRTADITKTYADAVKSVGDELNLPVVDLWTAFLKTAGWEEGKPLLGKTGTEGNDKLRDLLSDGLHFTSNGYKLMYKEVTNSISSKLPEVTPAKFPYVLPNYDQYTP